MKSRMFFRIGCNEAKTEYSCIYGKMGSPNVTVPVTSTRIAHLIEQLKDGKLELCISPTHCFVVDDLIVRWKIIEYLEMILERNPVA